MFHRALVLVWSLCCWGAQAVNGDSDEGFSLRLVDGDGRCRGRLQVQMMGQEWTGVWAWDVPLWLGHRLCAELDCGAPLFMERTSLSVSVFSFVFREGWSVIMNATCEDASLSRCFGSRGFGRSNDRLELSCSDSVRLVSGRSLCSGSLQIRDQSSDRSWTSVYEGALGRRGAEVLCRELGCGAPLLQGELSPLGQMFQCEGNESALMNCPRNQTRTDPGTCCGPALHLTCSEPLRLVGGSSRCEGTVELKFRGDWRRVVTSDPWDLEAAAAVCRDLDCGSAVSTERREWFSRSEVWSVRPECVKKAAAVRDCVWAGSSGHRLEVLCSDSVRLVSGRGLCSGSVQIRDQSSDRSWTSVCEGALDRRGAEVLCRELGCGAPLLQGELSPLGQMFHCEGHESALTDCPRNQTSTDAGTCSGPALHLTCSELRLVGGASHCEGTVELVHRGEWRRLINYWPWDLREQEAAGAVCRDLDCGSFVSVETRRGQKKSDTWILTSDCVKKKAALKDCVFDTVPYDERALVVVCSDSVRLVSGQTSCSGSLQIRDQSWTSVCEGALDRRGAEVLCRELGCGPPLLQGELSPLGQMFHCEGHESALMDCPRNQTRTDPGTCSGPILNLTCSEPLRLVGGSSRCEGTVELKYRGEWRRMVSLLPWDLAEQEFLAAVCRVLDCGSVVSAETRAYNRAHLWVVYPECVKKTAAPKDCAFDEMEGAEHGLEVVCSESVRLVSERSLCSGSLQIRDHSSDQSWTSVCEGALDRRGAEVLCRELDCGAPLLQGELSPLGQMFHCEGHESALTDCPRNQTRTNPGTCSGPDLQLTCSEPLRLVGGSSRCEGAVEVKHRGEWRRVVPSLLPERWDLEAVDAVCRVLDCGSALSAEVKGGLNKTDVWSRADCVMKTPLRGCAVTVDHYPGGGLEVMCSELVRLVSGRSLCSGSLQIRDQSSDRPWTSVCEGALGRRGAEVLCRELGCGAPFYQGELSPLGQTFHCEGHESALTDCPRNRTRTDPGTCSGPALNLTCSEPLRLVGGSGRCEGTVELRYRGEWRRVRRSAGTWRLRAASAVCRDLGCGSAVSVTEKTDLSRGEAWSLSPLCVERAAAVMLCVDYGSSGRDGLAVVCSDHQESPGAP